MLYGLEEKRYTLIHYYEEKIPFYTPTIAPTIQPFIHPIKTLGKGVAKLFLKIGVGINGRYGAVFLKEKRKDR